MSLIAESWRRNAVLTGLGLLMLAVMIPMAVGVRVDPRIFAGAPVWLKPTRIALSLAAYALTPAGFSGHARPVGRSLWIAT